jgi:hypothetical protein
MAKGKFKITVTSKISIDKTNAINPEVLPDNHQAGNIIELIKVKTETIKR